MTNPKITYSINRLKTFPRVVAEMGGLSVEIPFIGLTDEDAIERAKQIEPDLLRQIEKMRKQKRVWYVERFRN